MISLFVFVLGLITGSFVNVCIYRIPREESISFPPSHCTSCGVRIKPYDLFPVISYIILGGKCRNCGDRISISYPLTELSVGLLFLALYYVYGISFDFLRFMVLIPLILVIGIIDLKTSDVYFKTTITGIILGILFIIIFPLPI